MKERGTPEGGAIDLPVPTEQPLNDYCKQPYKGDGGLLSSIEHGLLSFRGCLQPLDTGLLVKYDIWTSYRSVESVRCAYNAVKRMPLLWKPLIKAIEGLQSEDERDWLYKELGKKFTHERSWFSNKRQKGVLGFILPTSYERCGNMYPRLRPLGPGSSKLG
jgi:hypothetical protein